MLSADIYRQLSAEDKKVWKQLSDVGKALFVKSMPTTVENAAQLRSAMKHETEEDDSTEDNDDDDSAPEREVKHLSITQNDEGNTEVEAQQHQLQTASPNESGSDGVTPEQREMERLVNALGTKYF